MLRVHLVMLRVLVMASAFTTPSMLAGVGDDSVLSTRHYALPGSVLVRLLLLLLSGGILHLLLVRFSRILALLALNLLVLLAQRQGIIVTCGQVT